MPSGFQIRCGASSILAWPAASGRSYGREEQQRVLYGLFQTSGMAAVCKTVEARSTRARNSNASEVLSAARGLAKSGGSVQSRALAPCGDSSTGRASVLQAECWGFKFLSPYQEKIVIGVIVQWEDSSPASWKSEFESLWLHHCFTTGTGERVAPAFRPPW